MGLSSCITRAGGSREGGGEFPGDEGEDGGVGAIDEAADSGWEFRDALASIGENLGLTEVEDRVGGQIVGLGAMVFILFRRLPGGDLVFVVLLLLAVVMGLLALGIAVSLPLSPFEARICHGSHGAELGMGRLEYRN